MSSASSRWGRGQPQAAAGRRDTAGYLAVIGRLSAGYPATATCVKRWRAPSPPINGQSTADERPISARLAADWRLVAAWARRDPNSPLVFHRNGIAIRRWRTACRLSGATQRCLKPGCSKRIENSRRTGATRQTISSWASIWRSVNIRSSSSMRGDTVSRASRFYIPARVSTSLWSAAPLRVSAGDEERCTSRSRRPGTCGRRSVPSLSSTHFGITWSIRWRPFGCARPDRWAETSGDLTNAEQIAQRLRTGVVTQCQLLPANYMQLRRAWGEYYRLRRERARLKTLLVHQLYGVFPELVGEWHTVTAPGCPAVLRAGLPPQRIADLTKTDFIRVVQAHRRGRRMWRFKIEQVWEKAGRTVAAPHGHQAAMREVTRLVERIDCIGDQLDHVAAELQTFLGENAKPPNFPKDSGSILLLGCTARPLDEPSSVALRPSG